MKMLAFASAGAAATSYLQWNAFLEPDVTLVPIDIAGRGTRSSEPFSENMDALMTDIEKQTEKALAGDTAFACFGHSFGCDIIFELVTRRIAAGKPLPSHLFLFGNTPPFSLKRRMKIAHLPDAEFMKAMEFFGGIDAQLYRFPDILRYFRNIMRADMRLVEEYEDREHLLPQQKWDIPLSIFCGKDDNTFDHVLLQDWKQCTSAHCSFYEMEGGHFFLNDHAEEIAEIILQTQNRLHRKEMRHVG